MAPQIYIPVVCEMARAILLIAMGLLALYGCAVGITRLTRWMWMPRKLKRITVVPLRGHIENIEQILHGTTAEMLSEQGGGEVFLLDLGVDEDTRRLIDCLQSHGGYSPVGTWEELEQRLQLPEE